MEMRLRAPVTRGYFFLLGALRLVNAASPRNIDQKKISSGTQGTSRVTLKASSENIKKKFTVVYYSDISITPTPRSMLFDKKTRIKTGNFGL